MNPESGSPALPDIQDIADPEALPDLLERLALAGGVALFLLLLAAGGVWLYRALSRRAADGPSPEAVARQRLARLAAQMEQMAPNAFSLALSDTLKDYLAARFGDPLRYETSEEFLARLSQARAAALPPSTRDQVASFLAVADEIKYGRPPDAEARKPSLLQQAQSVIASSQGSAGNPAVAPSPPAGTALSR